MVPTHYRCNICGSNFYVITDKRKKYRCEKCKQLYELVPGKYGGIKILLNENLSKDGRVLT
jgi:DNA-directed RNA polymerase subunit RPC12/RpoP